MCNTGIYPTYVSHMYNYMCNTPKNYTCITCMAQSAML